jgi:hypothetical protein
MAPHRTAPTCSRHGGWEISEQLSDWWLLKDSATVKYFVSPKTSEAELLENIAQPFSGRRNCCI